MEAAAVLVLTSPDDITSDLVIEALNRRGVPVVRVDPADIGRGVTFAARLGHPPGGWAGHLATDTRYLDLSRIRSVYHRRPSPWTLDHVPPEARDFAVAEARYGFGGLLANLSARYVNHPSATARAERKPAQLVVAHELGFTVPPTLITNDADAVRRFEAEEGPLIYKTFRSVPPADGRAGVVWTQRIDAFEVDDSVSVTAHAFQAEVEKGCDVRVTVVGRRVFASTVTAPDSPLDWRRADWEHLTFTPVAVPQDVTHRIHEYLESFGLVFGCFDFIIDHRDVWHWIECNPNGQWGFLPDADSIADAFADVLQADEHDSI